MDQWMIWLGFSLTGLIAGTLLLMYLHRQYKESLKPRDLNILVEVTSYIVNSVGTGFGLYTALTVWRLLFGQLNMIVYIVCLESSFCAFSIVLGLVLVSLAFKIALTIDFDRVHNLDPEELGQRAFWCVAGPCLLVTIVNLAYTLGTDTSVHVNMVHYSGVEAAAKHINVSYLMIFILAVLDVVMMLAEKTIAWFLLKKWCPKTIRMAEKSNNRLKTSKAFSIRNIVKGIGFSAVCITAIVLRVGIFGVQIPTDQLTLLFHAMLELGLFLTMSQFTLHEAMVSYLRRRLRQFQTSRSLKTTRKKSFVSSNQVAPQG